MSLLFDIVDTIWLGEGDCLKEDKVSRVLALYSQLLAGQTIQKPAAAQQYGVNERSIQRDIEDIRAFCRNGMAVGDGTPCDIVYDYVEKGYRMEGGQVQKLSNSEILALCKILLDSRAFVKTEMEEMLRKVISCCVPASNQAMVTRLVNNEAFHYVEPRAAPDEFPRHHVASRRGHPAAPLCRCGLWPAEGPENRSAAAEALGPALFGILFLSHSLHRRQGYRKDL